MAIKDLRVDLTPHIRKAEIFAKRSVLSKTFSGNWVTSFKGRGIEFAGYRSYQYGDDASLIDWRASLRAKEAVVREFEEYRSFSVFIMLDVSNSMLFSSTDKLKAEYAAELAYAVAEGVLRGGDAVGLGMFTDELVVNMHPNIGRGMLDRIKKELGNPENYGGGLDFKKVLRQTVSFLKTNAVLIIISDFLGLDKGWERYVRMLSNNFELLGLMVRDPRDRALPRNVGQYAVLDPYSKRHLYIDVNDYFEKYKALVEEEERYLRAVFKGVRGGMTLIMTDKDYAEPLMRFLRRREFITMTT
ncbi:DUF58 domain-containing protein [Candidatus Woesearchaeota archaeon]|nr:DUF58 domain-containing protein [Candidatus Woesearchaeota archaeon]